MEKTGLVKCCKTTDTYLKWIFSWNLLYVCISIKRYVGIWISVLSFCWAKYHELTYYTDDFQPNMCERLEKTEGLNIFLEAGRISVATLFGRIYTNQHRATRVAIFNPKRHGEGRHPSQRNHTEACKAPRCLKVQVFLKSFLGSVRIPKNPIQFFWAEVAWDWDLSLLGWSSWWVSMMTCLVGRWVEHFPYPPIEWGHYGTLSKLHTWCKKMHTWHMSLLGCL